MRVCGYSPNQNLFVAGLEPEPLNDRSCFAKVYRYIQVVKSMYLMRSSASGEFAHFTQKVNVRLFYDGFVQWVPVARFSSNCKVDVTYFPFDTQICYLKFGSWSYNGWMVDLRLNNGIHAVDLSEYVENNEWKVIRTNATRNIIVYHCCPDPYIDITFMLVLARRSAPYIQSILLPSGMIQIITLAIYFLPLESKERITMAMLNFVSLCVLKVLILKTAPFRYGDIAPLIGMLKNSF